MEKQPVLEAFDLTEAILNAVLGHYDAIEKLCPFLKALDEDTRKAYLKVEEEKITRPLAVYTTLMERPELNKSDTLKLPAFGAQITCYQRTYSILKRTDQVRSLFSDTVLGIGHRLTLDSNEGQKQIKRAAEDDAATNEKLYKEVLKAKKQAAPMTEAELARWAARNGYVKAPDEPKK